MKIFKPTYMLTSPYHITPEWLRKNGMKAVCVDLDNTLIAWNNQNGTPEMKQWLIKMKQADIPVVIVSNNKRERVAKVANQFGVDYVSSAKKPTTRGINKALKKLGLPTQHVVMIGDQILTDIIAGNLCHMCTILVKPLVETDLHYTRINRFFERYIMKLLYRRYKLEWRETLE